MRSPQLFLLTVVLAAGCTEVSPSDRSTYAAILDRHSGDGATVTIDRRTHLPQDVKHWLADFLAIGEAAPCFGGHGLSRTIVKDLLVKNARSSWLRGDIQGVRTYSVVGEAAFFSLPHRLVLRDWPREGRVQFSRVGRDPTTDSLLVYVDVEMGGTLFLLKASEDSLEVIDSCYSWAS